MFKSVALVLVFVTISYAFEFPSFSISPEVEYQRIARQTQGECGPYEKYGCGIEVKCGDPKHDNKNVPCKTGCFCINGYARKGAKCVEESECRPKRTPTEIAPDREAEPLAITEYAQDLKAEPLIFDGPVSITYQKGHIHVHF